MQIGGGGDVAQQYLRAGLVDEVQVHLVPLFLGGGVRLFDAVSRGPAGLERTQVAKSPTGVVHLSYRPAQL